MGIGGDNLFKKKVEIQANTEEPLITDNGPWVKIEQKCKSGNHRF